MRSTLLFKLFFVFAFIKCPLHAQVTLDHVINASTFGSEPYLGQTFYTTQLSENETKYVFCDESTNTLNLYDMDLTPFLLNIALPAPLQNGIRQPIYITRSLFDCDSTNIEFIYESPSQMDEFWIMRTDGTQLLYMDSVNAPYCIGGCLGLSDIIVPIRNTSDGTKLFLQKLDPNGTSTQLYIYSVCGTLLTENFYLPTQQTTFVTGVYPNPSQQQVNFRINLPDNINNYQLVITSGNATEVKRQLITNSSDIQTLDVSAFSSGTYFYSLCTASKVYQTGKFIVAH